MDEQNSLFAEVKEEREFNGYDKKRSTGK